MIAEHSAEQEGRMTPEDRDGAGLKRLREKDKREEEKIRNCVTPRERMTLPPELCLAIPARLPAEFSLSPARPGPPGPTSNVRAEAALAGRAAREGGFVSRELGMHGDSVVARSRPRCLETVVQS